MVANSERTDIHLVPDLRTAFEVARYLEARAVALDMEGTVGNYVGNEPYDGYFDDFVRGQARENMLLTEDEMWDRQDVAFGIVTNNTNKPAIDGEPGLVTRVADTLHIPFVHKGMRVGGVALRGKPSGELSGHFCELVDADPARTVLIDDQGGVRIAGEAVRAGLRAVIVPNPIGLPRRRGGGVEEHPWVRRARRFEQPILRSLGRQGLGAGIAYRIIAGIDPALIGELHDHRSA